MKILFVASEAVPFAKTGGLADVAGALPIALHNLGHDVRVVMPKYRCVDEERYNLLPILGDMDVKLGEIHYIAQVQRTLFPQTKVPVYFIQNAAFFDRENLYMEAGEEYPDNAQRFAFFSKAVPWLLKGLDWIPDVIHCNDWQTALIPVYLNTLPEMRDDAGLASIRVLYTIHNMAYQGVYPAAEAERIGIGPDLFHPAGLEYYGNLNLMKGGILFSDYISTVSPTYAREIQTAEYGAGLEGVLSNRKSQLTGILNGIDYQTWNPETDTLIPAQYGPDCLQAKRRCKAELQSELKLVQDADTLLIGIISRLDRQKGFDLIREAIDELMKLNVQVALLGTGAPEYHRFFSEVAVRYPKRFSTNLKFDNALAHRIEAGSDLFLMPSRYEPCGLNQLYSLRYGTPPVVRATGGLADSITDYDGSSLTNGTATGFVFEEYTATAMMGAIHRAIACFGNQTAWLSLVHNGMQKDFSWNSSARQYEDLYAKLVPRE